MKPFLSQQRELLIWYIPTCCFWSTRTDPESLGGFTQEVAILKLQKVGFTYPGTDRRVLSDVTLRCTLNSRIAVLGVGHHDHRC